MLPLLATQLRDATSGRARHCQTKRLDVWLLSGRIGPAGREIYGSVLSSDERERAGRYRFEADRDRSIAARGGLRWILSTYCACRPEALVFRTREHGKPELVDASVPVQFNVSHSGDCVLIGVTAGDECGVDIERSRSRLSEQAIAERFFCPREGEWLRRNKEGFLRLWTTKEAIIKAVGRGLSIPLSDVDVTDVVEGKSSDITLKTIGLEPQTLWLKEMSLLEDYAAAFAVVGAAREIRLMPD